MAINKILKKNRNSYKFIKFVRDDSFVNGQVFIKIKFPINSFV